MSAPESGTMPILPSQTLFERGLGAYGYSSGGLQELSVTRQIYMSNLFPSMPDIMHQLLLITTLESYTVSLSLTLYLLPDYMEETMKMASD